MVYGDAPDVVWPGTLRGAAPQGRPPVAAPAAKPSDADASRQALEGQIARKERQDVLAWLDRKIANAQRIIDTKFDRHGDARAMQRGWEILYEDIAAGLHAGAAQVADDVARGRE